MPWETVKGRCFIISTSRDMWHSRSGKECLRTWVKKIQYGRIISIRFKAWITYSTFSIHIWIRESSLLNSYRIRSYLLPSNDHFPRGFLTLSIHFWELHFNSNLHLRICQYITALASFLVRDSFISFNTFFEIFH